MYSKIKTKLLIYAYYLKEINFIALINFLIKNIFD